MTLAVALFGLSIAALGIAGALSPRHLLQLVTRVQAELGLYFIAGLRFLMGVALLLAAPASRTPLYLQVLGGLALASAVVTPFVGPRRFHAIVQWWRVRPAWVVRVWSLLVLVFGLSLVWTVFPMERSA